MSKAAPDLLARAQVDPARLAEICERYGLCELAVFGSVAAGRERSDSDVDVLFELAPGTRLGFSMFRMQVELEALFGRNVDLLSKDSIHPLIRDEVLSQARVLYAA